MQRVAKMSVVGIDFGNLSALIAQAAKGGVDVILNDASNRQTATCVSIQGKQRFLGDAGASIQRSNIKNTITCMKLLVGRKYEEEDVQAELARHAFRHERTPSGGVGFRITYNDEEIVVSAEHVLAMMLVKIKEIAAKANSNVQIGEAVISVPSWFTDAQKRGVTTACEIAELNCLKVVNESTAVALSFGIYKSAKKLFSETEPQHVMFLDLGYSCYTVSIVDFVQEKLTVRATACDRSVGGRDFDNIIVEHLAGVFETKYKKNIRSDKKAMLKLQVAAEKAKKLLSPTGVTESPVNVECLSDDIDLNCQLLRDEFESKSAPIIARLAVGVQQCLAEAGLQSGDLESVEIVGGTSRIGIIKRTLADALGLDTSLVNNGLKTTMNSDEACARGSALQCAMLSSKIKVKPFSIIDKVPYPIHVFFEAEDSSAAGSLKAESKGEEDYEEDATAGASASSVEIYSKGDDYPRPSRRITFRKKNVDFKFTVAYPESASTILPPGQDRHIATYTVKIPAGKPPLDVRVGFNLDRNGCVYVTSAEMMEPIVEEATLPEAKAKEGAEVKEGDAKETKEGEGKGDEATPPPPPKKKFSKIPLTIERITFGLDKQQIKDAKELEAAMANEDRLITETADKRNELESYIYSMRDKVDGELKNFGSEDEKSNLKALLMESEDWLYGDGFDSVKSMYVRKLDDLRAIGDKIEFRFAESLGRSEAVEGLKKQVDLCRQFASNRDESYSHITDDERDRIITEAKGAEDWMYDLLAKQTDLPDSVDPVLTSAMIQTRRQSLFNVTNPIMIKPKPKPAPPPAPETKPEDKGAPDGKENDGEGKNDIPTSDTPAEESKTAVDESKQEGAMEVE